MIAGQRTARSARKDETEAVWLKARNLTLAFCAGIIVFSGVGVLLVQKGPAADLRVTFYAIAFFLALGSVAFRRTQLRWMRLEAIYGLRGTSGLLHHLYISTVASGAMGEIIGIMALLIAFLGGLRQDVLTFGVVSLVTTLVGYPRRLAWIRTVEYLAGNQPDQDQETGSETLPGLK